MLFFYQMVSLLCPFPAQKPFMIAYTNRGIQSNLSLLSNDAVTVKADFDEDVEVWCATETIITLKGIFRIFLPLLSEDCL